MSGPTASAWLAGSVHGVVVHANRTTGVSNPASPAAWLRVAASVAVRLKATVSAGS